LFIGLVLTEFSSLQHKQFKPTTMETPEYIEGIPTEKKRSKERFTLILGYYETLWKPLQREGLPNAVKNKFLNADIYIVRNESDKKTAREALHNWKSTYAVKHLRTVIEEAKPLKGQPLFVSRKEGEQKRNGYKNMVLLYHHFVNEEKDYLDFVVKLTIGVMTSGKHVQYCVNKIEVQ
jgi:hypothetical protein